MTTSKELRMRLRLTLAIYHLKLWLDLGELESVAQCETFFGEGGFVSIFGDRNVLAIRDRFEAQT